jgi:hypothetical protein
MHGIETKSQVADKGLGIRDEMMSPELRQVVEAWDSLPEAVRAGIVAMVKAAGRHDAGTR